jgi:hypothetical protein
MSVPSVTLTPSDYGHYFNFGAAIGISGDGSRSIVGAPGARGFGSVYLFDRNVGYAQTQILSKDEATGQKFGESLAISGDGGSLVIGSIYGLGYEDATTGAVYLYEFASSWSNTGKFFPEINIGMDRFGFTTAINSDGSIFCAGSPYDDYCDANEVCISNHGAVYFFCSP